MLVKKGIPYYRCKAFEDRVNSLVTIKISGGRGKYTCYSGLYRNWQCDVANQNFNSRSENDQLERFKLAVDNWDKIKAKGYKLIILGDLNIDRLLTNYPSTRHDSKECIPVLKDFQTRNNMVLINKQQPTRYRLNERPTMLDLLISDELEKVEKIELFGNIISEHLGIEIKHRSEGIVVNLQFFVT